MANLKKPLLVAGAALAAYYLYENYAKAAPKPAPLPAPVPGKVFPPVIPPPVVTPHPASTGPAVPPGTTAPDFSGMQAGAPGSFDSGEDPGSGFFSS